MSVDKPENIREEITSLALKIQNNAFPRDMIPQELVAIVRKYPEPKSGTGKHVAGREPDVVSKVNLHAELLALMILGHHGPGTGRHDTYVLDGDGPSIEGSLTITAQALDRIPEVKDVIVLQVYDRSRMQTTYNYKIKLGQV